MVITLEKFKNLIKRKKWLELSQQIQKCNDNIVTLNNRLSQQIQKCNDNIVALTNKLDQKIIKYSDQFENLFAKIDLINFLIEDIIKSHILNSNLKEIKIKTSNNNININQCLKDLDHFYFLPNKGNLGDILIAASEFQYFDANDLNYNVYDVLSEEIFDKPFNLVYGGGGIWYHLYKKDYEQIVEIFKSNLLKKCVILPSSFYDCEDVINTLDERFTVFCREKQSYNYCISLNNKAKFILANDMVIDSDFEIYNQKFYNKSQIEKFINNLNYQKLKQYIYLYKKYKKAKSTAYEQIQQMSNFKVGYLLRSDREKNVQLNSNLKTLDVSSLIGGFACDKSFNYLCSKLFLEIIDKFDIVITDRLHVGICATKLGKQVLLFDNTYKKITEVYKFSLFKFPNACITTVKTLNSDIKEAISKLSIKHQKNNFSINSFEDFLIQYGSIDNKYGIERIIW